MEEGGADGSEGNFNRFVEDCGGWVGRVRAVLCRDVRVLLPLARDVRAADEDSGWHLLQLLQT